MTFDHDTIQTQRLNVSQTLSRLTALACVVLSCTSAFATCDPPDKQDSSAIKEQLESLDISQFLNIGDAAPSVEIQHWLRGNERKSFADGRIYVLAFWSTWCPHCHASFENLSELQQRYEHADVIVLAVADEKLQTVVDFLTQPQWSSRMQFAIATDPDLTTQTDYMEAAAIGEIPTVFLIGHEGIIEWVGHPRDLEQPLEQVIDATWDRAAFKETFDQQMLEERHRFAEMQRFKEAYRAKDWDRLLAMFDEAIKQHPDVTHLKMQRFMLLIGEMDRAEQGYRYGRKLLRKFWNDAEPLNNLAWFVLTHETVQVRDLDFARRAADRACYLTESNDPRMLDTLARVYFEDGDLAEAIRYQEKAVKRLEPNDRSAEIIRETLENYRKLARDR